MVVVVAALSKRIEYLDGPHLRKEAASAHGRSQPMLHVEPRHCSLLIFCSGVEVWKLWMSGLFYFELRVNCPQTMPIHQICWGVLSSHKRFEIQSPSRFQPVGTVDHWVWWPSLQHPVTQCCILVLQAILRQADLLSKTRGEQWSFFGSDGMEWFLSTRTIDINGFSMVLLPFDHQH